MALTVPLERISRIAYAEEDAFRKTLQAGTQTTSFDCDITRRDDLETACDRVTRELGTSGGDEPVESPIWWFRVDGAGAPPAVGTLDLRFAALLRALGLSELEGFTPVSATLEDGRVLPLQTLEELLAAIEAGEIPVMSVRVR